MCAFGRKLVALILSPASFATLRASSTFKYILTELRENDMLTYTVGAVNYESIQWLNHQVLRFGKYSSIMI